MLTKTTNTQDAYTLHALMQLALTLNIQAWADKIQVEHRLKNNNIADIYFQWSGYELIIEVKTEYKVSLIEKAISKYWSQCDFLLFAAPAQQIPQVPDRQTTSWDNPSVEKVGLIAIRNSGLKLIRPPERLKRKPGPQG
jgi:hypothetical protein